MVRGEFSFPPTSFLAEVDADMPEPFTNGEAARSWAVVKRTGTSIDMLIHKAVLVSACAVIRSVPSICDKAMFVTSAATESSLKRYIHAKQRTIFGKLWLESPRDVEAGLGMFGDDLKEPFRSALTTYGDKPPQFFKDHIIILYLYNGGNEKRSVIRCFSNNIAAFTGLRATLTEPVPVSKMANFSAEANDAMRSRCGGCRISNEKMRACSRCGLATYCSKACQANHWPKHRQHCIATDLVSVRDQFKAEKKHLKL